MSTTENHPGEGDGSLKILNKYLPTKCIYTYMCIYMKSYTEYNIHFYMLPKRINWKNKDSNLSLINIYRNLTRVAMGSPDKH